MSVISLDLLSTATYPNTSRSSLAHALTKWSGDRSRFCIKGMAYRLAIDGHMADLIGCQPLPHLVANTLL
jgi:hypothetical protein